MTVPQAPGKSTLARQAAQRLGFLYVDTGAIYRTVALKALESAADPADPEQVVPLLSGLNVKMDHGPDGGQRMFLDGADVSDAIRQHRVSGAASQVAAIPQVRDFLLDFQRRQAREHDVIMDGRDIGTVVLPNADVKIFLTAAPEARAHRRARELELRGSRPTMRPSSTTSSAGTSRTGTALWPPCARRRTRCWWIPPG